MNSTQTDNTEDHLSKLRDRMIDAGDREKPGHVVILFRLYHDCLREKNRMAKAFLASTKWDNSATLHWSDGYLEGVAKSIISYVQRRYGICGITQDQIEMLCLDPTLKKFLHP
jgi:hypothetical protein